MAGKKTYDELKNWLKDKDLQKRIDKLAEKYKDKKVIIYGAGILASVIFDNYNLNNLNIIAIAALNFKDNNEKFYDYKAIYSHSIKDNIPDVILLATLPISPIKMFLKDCIFPQTGNIKVESIVKKNTIEKINDFFLYFPHFIL